MTDGEILDIAVRQSATDSACRPEDFFKGEHVVVRSRADMGARKYLSLPFALDLASYGNNVVASADEALIPGAEAYLRGRRTEACFETPALHELDAMLLPFGLRTFFQAEYFLPDLNAMREIACAYPTRILAREAFSGSYLPQWSNALCKARKANDVLCVGAYDGGLFRRLRTNVADRHRRSARIPEEGRRRRARFPSGGGNACPRQSAVLLRRVVQSRVEKDRARVRVQTRVGAAHRKTRRIYPLRERKYRI